MGAMDPDGPWTMPGDDQPWDDELSDYRAIQRELLARAVGGPSRLDALDAAPLPDEAFDWAGIPPDVHDRVAEVVALSDRCCDELLGVEYRTAVRRVLAQIASRGPQVFRHPGRADTAAAAICWAVGTTNYAFDQRRGGLTARPLLAHFDLQGSVSGRAGTLLDAGGFPRFPYDFVLGSPDYLVAEQRRQMLEARRRL